MKSCAVMKFLSILCNIVVKCYLTIKAKEVRIVKEVISSDVLPLAMFDIIQKCADMWQVEIYGRIATIPLQ